MHRNLYWAHAMSGYSATRMQQTIKKMHKLETIVGSLSRFLLYHYNGSLMWFCHTTYYKRLLAFFVPGGYPDWIFPIFWASKSVKRRTLCSSETSIDIFWCSKIVKRFDGNTAHAFQSWLDEDGCRGETNLTPWSIIISGGGFNQSTSFFVIFIG